MRSPFKRKEKALTADGNVVAAIQGGGWSAIPLLGGGARERILAIYNVAQSANYGWLYSRSPAVRQVLDGVVRDVGALDLRLYEELSEAEMQPRPDHPAAMSVRYPSETTTGDGLIRGLVKDFLIHDNAYALLLPGTGEQIQIIRIPAHMVEVQGSSMFVAENYRVWPQGAWTSAGSWGGGGTYQDFLPEQILHWHGEHPHDPRVGLSHLDTLRGVIAEDAALQQASVELANAGLQEPTWIFRPTDAPQWSREAAQAFEEDMTARIRRRNSKPVVLEEGMELRSFGVTPKDAEVMAVRQWAVAQTANEYGVPRGKAGLDGASQEDEDAYMADVLVPLCKNYASMLNLRLLVRVWDWTDGCFKFNLDERVMGNARLVALVSATGRPVMLTNEARATMGLPPVADGDELVTPLNVIVGEKPSPQVMPIQDPNRPPQDGSYRTDQGPTPVGPGGGPPPPPKAIGWQKNLGVADAPANGSTFTPLPQFHPRRAADMERQRRNVDTMQDVVQRHLNRVGRSLQAKANLETDWDRWDAELSKSLDRDMKRIVQAEGDLYSMHLASPQNFDMSRVQHYLTAMSEGAATAINDTVRQEIDSLGLDTALARFSAHVASAGASLGARSTIWAREEAARQSPDYSRRVKTWIADTERHAEFDGTTVPVGDEWPAGFAPGGAPGCACSMSVT